ncbi:MAG TPA: superoxide dismutase family protein [Burkholderiaceae bacterium]|nr:superoxide dismutase family protein [Burkholderiaceae bacterium]
MRALTILAVLLALAGCQSSPKGPSASAQLDAAKGGRVVGKVTFQEVDGGTSVRAEVSGLPPNRQFGFHVHDKGDCSAPDFMSAAGHFNPDTKPHGDHKTAESHAGDLPNLASDGQGNAVLAYTSSKLTVASGPRSVVGRAVVVHENPDDYRSQPAGNSGPRIACGIIKG